MLHQSFDVNGDIVLKFSQEIENEKLIYFSQTNIKIVKIINHFHLVFFKVIDATGVSYIWAAAIHSSDS